MSALTEALESIDNWVQGHMPDHPAVMRQGLSQAEIEDNIQGLSFQLPEEVHELYRWKNGGEKPFIPDPDAWDLATFFTLKEAISAAYEWQGSVIFPLFLIEETGYFTVCTPETSALAPVYCSDIPEVAIAQPPQYSSLTAMMQELAAQLQGRA